MKKLLIILLCIITIFNSVVSSYASTEKSPEVPMSVEQDKIFKYLMGPEDSKEGNANTGIEDDTYSYYCLYSQEDIAEVFSKTLDGIQINGSSTVFDALTWLFNNSSYIVFRYNKKTDEMNIFFNTPNVQQSLINRVLTYVGQGYIDDTYDVNDTEWLIDVGKDAEFESGMSKFGFNIPSYTYLGEYPNVYMPLDNITNLPPDVLKALDEGGFWNALKVAGWALFGSPTRAIRNVAILAVTLKAAAVAASLGPAGILVAGLIILLGALLLLISSADSIIKEFQIKPPSLKDYNAMVYKNYTYYDDRDINKIELFIEQHFKDTLFNWYNYLNGTDPEILDKLQLAYKAVYDDPEIAGDVKKYEEQRKERIKQLTTAIKKWYQFSYTEQNLKDEIQPDKTYNQKYAYNKELYNTLSGENKEIIDAYIKANEVWDEVKDYEYFMKRLDNREIVENSRYQEYLSAIDELDYQYYELWSFIFTINSRLTVLHNREKARNQKEIYDDGTLIYLDDLEDDIFTEEQIFNRDYAVNLLNWNRGYGDYYNSITTFDVDIHNDTGLSVSNVPNFLLELCEYEDFTYYNDIGTLEIIRDKLRTLSSAVNTLRWEISNAINPFEDEEDRYTEIPDNPIESDADKKAIYNEYFGLGGYATLAEQGLEQLPSSIKELNKLLEQDKNAKIHLFQILYGVDKKGNRVGVDETGKADGKEIDQEEFDRDRSIRIFEILFKPNKDGLNLFDIVTKSDNTGKRILNWDNPSSSDYNKDWAKVIYEEIHNKFDDEKKFRESINTLIAVLINDFNLQYEDPVDTSNRVMPYDINTLMHKDIKVLNIPDPRVELYNKSIIGSILTGNDLDFSSILLGDKITNFVISLSGRVAELTVILNGIITLDTLEDIGFSPVNMWDSPTFGSTIVAIIILFVLLTIVKKLIEYFRHADSKSLWDIITRITVSMIIIVIIITITTHPKESWNTTKKFLDIGMNISESVVISQEDEEALTDLKGNETSSAFIYWLQYFDIWTSYNTGYLLFEKEQKITSADTNIMPWYKDIDTTIPKINGKPIRLWSVMLADSFSKIDDTGQIHKKAYRVVDNFLSPIVKANWTSTLSDKERTAVLSVEQNPNYNGKFQATINYGKVLSVFMAFIIMLIKVMTFVWVIYKIYTFIINILLSVNIDGSISMKQTIYDLIFPVLSLFGISLINYIVLTISFNLTGTAPFVDFMLMVFICWLVFGKILSAWALTRYAPPPIRWIITRIYKKKGNKHTNQTTTQTYTTAISSKENTYKQELLQNKAGKVQVESDIAKTNGYIRLSTIYSIAGYESLIKDTIYYNIASDSTLMYSMNPSNITKIVPDITNRTRAGTYRISVHIISGQVLKFDLILESANDYYKLGHDTQFDRWRA